MITYNVSLKNFNTFGIDAKAKMFIEIVSISQLQSVLKEFKNEKLFILGGGSNMLLTQDIDALVLYINIKGITTVSSTNQHTVIEANAGENWHEFVLFTIAQNLGGLENLSLIPGNVGTTPVQNIGAYGVEIKDILLYCKAVEVATGEIVTFTNAQCAFEYRESIFKKELKNKYIIVSVAFQLTNNEHQIHTQYGVIEAQLQSMQITNPTIKNVSDAVIAIRQSKLPDPKVIGNSGSFFKNPIVEKSILTQIQTKYPEVPFYTVNESLVKIPAGWLIEQTGYKGFKKGDAGVHNKQALVLVNYGGATGQELLALSQEIQQQVFNKFGVAIEAEVNII
ncbi:UDP-N-acetylmuramate dehydrogenase [Flavobacterium agricola]|uniref:UDP-N-acetylenolpyruvoylglucosamine reductase n=1 Tax=Flavobacterium agricola TaxID=2870839 RepID=A0ABY6LZA9_9FLAO|nr:UDP-N-acetylmuramate dehydrogenase [Flavobacterium agricola]UYW01657.1 UDP-N-acetylmuramate dehydrogenase [Flavobacterium agricola]